MRWKLLVIVSVFAGLLALGLWSALAIGVFGSARVMARSDWQLLGSSLIPLFTAVFAGFFVYRHTSRRRRLQAMMTAILVLLVATASYLMVSGFFITRLMIPRTSEVRHAR